MHDYIRFTITTEGYIDGTTLYKFLSSITKLDLCVYCSETYKHGVSEGYYIYA